MGPLIVRAVLCWTIDVGLMKGWAKVNVIYPDVYVAEKMAVVK